MTKILEIKFKGKLMGGSDKEPWIQCPILKSYQTIELANKYLKAGYKIGDNIDVVIHIKPKE